MAFPFGKVPTLAELCERLKSLGCSIKELSGDMVTPDGTCRVVYACNPKNGKFVILPIIAVDEAVSPWLIGNIERRLGVNTGYPTL